ncbi:UDP-N-acetylmuramoyl-tripeptide--D-alanyl-D-alanine ligase [uncultured Parabacteroides sp.]|uniref:UDP-N-acetylmuramoyl-tripeptide--D-alanyl-D- alanine ligase n=1 Tax=uncultured Parabacteroides sp. TaxID=512312 RepID=UPI0026100FB5|nr:UDP-N-acetylmuramoyl-tripeptide--D-alanyl-D-alanine ligase [uncultured Parabacteroides sp.]
MIPKVIHQVWEGRTEYLGETYQELGDTWKKYHPDWKYEFWDEYRMDSFLYEHFPEMADLYFGYPYGIQRWHVIRYLILYKMGGLYADFDYECLESFDKYIQDESKCYFAMEPELHCSSLWKRVCINNTLMVTPPNHPFFEAIITHLKMMSVFYTGNKNQEVPNTTGLSMLTDLYEKYANKDAIGIFLAEQVAPFSKKEMDDYFHGKADEELLEEKIQKAIAIHYFNGSWLLKDGVGSNGKLTMTPISELYRIFTQYPVICVDEKNILPDSLFFAIQGNSYNGNGFAEKALEGGCRYAVVDDPSVVADERFLLVDNVQKALEQLADHHHRILKTPVIGITGTCGKTTTKELVTAVLSTCYKLESTPGSENATLGASLVLLRLKPEHDIAVIEMAACHPGMIRELARIVRPEYGIITNVGLAHLKGFGSFEGVLRTKGELFDYLRLSGGKVFIHKENATLQSIAGGLDQVTYGESDDCFVYGYMISSDPCLCFNWKYAGIQHTVSTQMAGDYNLYNALAAISVGLCFDISSKEISRAISGYTPVNHRSQWKKTLRNELLIDTFNANPCSMRAALASFSKLSVIPKAVILGDMLGLGDESLKLHIEIIELLHEYRFDKVILCGNQFMTANAVYPCFPDVEALSRYLSINKFQGYKILIKGSNKIYLGMVVHLL